MIWTHKLKLAQKRVLTIKEDFEKLDYGERLHKLNLTPLKDDREGLQQEQLSPAECVNIR